MLFDTQTIDPASSRALAELVSLPPKMRSSRVADDHGYEQHPFSERESPPRACLYSVRQQDREDHRREHGAGHGPTGLACELIVRGLCGVAVDESCSGPCRPVIRKASCRRTPASARSRLAEGSRSRTGARPSTTRASTATASAPTAR